MKKVRFVEWIRMALPNVKFIAKKAGSVMLRIVSWPVIALYVVIAMLCRRLHMPCMKTGALVSKVKPFCSRYSRHLLTACVLVLAIVVGVMCIPSGEITAAAKASVNTANVQADTANSKVRDGLCDTCSGSGSCRKCYGDGECDKCYGEGGHTCDSCFGSGTCNNCYGSGSYEYLGKYLRCTYCRGSGSCRPCKGVGSKNCYYCDNSGDCSYCSGLGTCRYCGGTGED